MSNRTDKKKKLFRKKNQGLSPVFPKRILRRALQGDARAQFSMGGLYIHCAELNLEKMGARSFAAGTTRIELQNANENEKKCLKELVSDQKKAASWYYAAARQGHEKSREILNQMFCIPEIAEKYALLGDAVAQYEVGCGLYYMKSPFGGRIKKAIFWLRLSAEQGYAEAQYLLGECLFYGMAESDSTATKEETAVQWLLKAANQGNAKAYNLLGVCSKHGWGIVKSDEQALHWWKQAALLGVRNAMYELCTTYYEEITDEEAVFFLHRLTESIISIDNRLVYYELGMRFKEGRGCERDYMQAVRWLRHAAVLEHEGARFELAFGSRNEFKNILSREERSKWVGILAKDGYPEMQYCLGTLYEQGSGPMLHARRKAIECFIKSADMANAKAQYMLGRCLLDNEDNEETNEYSTFPKDLKSRLQFAIELFEKAAEQGNADAMNSLSFCHQRFRNHRSFKKQGFLTLAKAEYWKKEAVRAGGVSEIRPDRLCAIFAPDSQNKGNFFNHEGCEESEALYLRGLILLAGLGECVQSDEEAIKWHEKAVEHEKAFITKDMEIRELLFPNEKISSEIKMPCEQQKEQWELITNLSENKTEGSCQDAVSLWKKLTRGGYDEIWDIVHRRAQKGVSAEVNLD